MLGRGEDGLVVRAQERLIVLPADPGVITDGALREWPKIECRSIRSVGT